MAENRYNKKHRLLSRLLSFSYNLNWKQIQSEFEWCSHAFYYDKLEKSQINQTQYVQILTLYLPVNTVWIGNVGKCTWSKWPGISSKYPMEILLIMLVLFWDDIKETAKYRLVTLQSTVAPDWPKSTAKRQISLMSRL